MKVRVASLAVLGACLLTASLLTTATASPASAQPATRNPSVAAADPGVLLSQNHPVTVSSSGGCCPAKNGVDGSATTRWASRSGADPQWFAVDLGGFTPIVRVRLQWDLSCATAYQIQASPDGVAWTAIFSTTTGDGGVDDLAVTGAGRYVRVLGTHRCRADSAHGYSLLARDAAGNVSDPAGPIYATTRLCDEPSPPTGSTTAPPQSFLNGVYGRLRTVEPAPDGGLWLTTSNNDGHVTARTNRVFHLQLG